MLGKKKKKVIGIQAIEHEALIKMIENMDGVSVKRTTAGVQISVQKQALSKSSVGVCIKCKNKKGKRINYLTPIYGVSEEKKDTLEFRQSSAIIAKSFY